MPGTRGPQTELLRRQLESMEDGGVFLIVAPPNPFRCPPGPYERASLVAYYFKQYKPKSKILILDAKDSFFEQDLFQDAWARHYPGMIEWLPGQFTGGVKSVNVKDLSVKTEAETFKAAVVNFIPPQMAGELAQQAGLADQSGWCPVEPTTFELKLQPGIHIVGDAIQSAATCRNPPFSPTARPRSAPSPSPRRSPAPSALPRICSIPASRFLPPTMR